MARRSARPTGEHTILVVDDQDDTLSSTQRLLEREGHRVLLAHGGHEALAILKDTDIHLVIVDYLMPRMTGAELVRQIRAFDPYIQIILQTGYAGEKPPRVMLGELDIQGYHDKADDPEKLLLWVAVSLKTWKLVGSLRERERLQNELVANCSHEFRTPLNIIAGYALLMENGDFGALPGDARPAIRSILDSVRSLSAMVDDFLGYTKLAAGVPDGGTEWIATADVVDECRSLATTLLERKPIAFRVYQAGEIPSHLLIDDVKLRTILRNLIGNAAKFTVAGEITFHVERAGDTLRFAVGDTGPGIDGDHHETIFEPFRQVDGSSTRRHGGVGLGLALARKLARVLGGDLCVESTVGVGSTFVLTLPLATVGADVDPRRIAG